MPPLPRPAPPISPGAYFPSQPTFSAPPVARRRPAWPGIVALVLVVLLLLGFGLQTWQLMNVSEDLNQANQRLEELANGQAYSGERLDAVEERTSALEQQAGEELDPEAVANAVLPSVFQVLAGEFTGTAFAVGSPTEAGGTNLLTNWHVVEPLYLEGGREVQLARTNQIYPAQILAVDETADLAWLQTTTAFDGLAAATEEVRAGQEIIVVGAPEGLTDTVTTGVVSNPAQELPDNTGPWVQFDAAINPGNSGGPVINAAQEVVGIATRKGTETEGLGFAVPISVACDLFEVCQ
jgi:putative serine protease PepD